MFGHRLRFDLADHAVAAPTNLARPGATANNVPALRLVVTDTVYLLSSGIPSLATCSAAPKAVHGEPGTARHEGWPLNPHEPVDPNEVATPLPPHGRRLSAAAVWYLPLGKPGGTGPQVLHAAARAGYTHLTVDPTDLTIGAARRRHRRTRPPAHAA